MAYTRPVAPEPLERIETFCNSARLLYGEDALADLADARAWLQAHGWHDLASTLDEAARHELREVREAIRAHLAGTTPEAAVATLNRYAQATLAPPQWSPEGRPHLPVAAATPLHALIGAMLTTLTAEELAGRRDRLKVCHAEQCRWVFYDRSPANNSVWCSMSICGARHKMRSYRTRHNDPPPPSR
ncbi:CGNR zinc finger domain-containing protein [Salinactinospora qingdaonensis]|uniref:CGNR zinc finger domain-containing protein n=1 Tax=Salinactinospora qingdaonensis TaxID=702744 RepID=A0ABP7GFA0_9ACTN